VRRCLLATLATLALDSFTNAPAAGVQRRITQAVETRAHAAAVAAARPSQAVSAFLLSCSGRWIRAARLPHMQLSNEEVVLRMQRYLRQPLSALAGLVGTRGLDARPERSARPASPPRRAQRAAPAFPGTLIDALGDSFMSGYHPKGDSEWSHLHNALCRAIAGFAAQAHVSSVVEGGRVRGTKKKPGDVRYAGDVGAHGSNELWVDATVVFPLCASYLSAASAARGAAASLAAGKKRTKYRNDIPGHVHFLPLPLVLAARTSQTAPFIVNV
jgi:hypothetical protein